jgi:hypothetical protein
MIVTCVNMQEFLTDLEYQIRDSGTDCIVQKCVRVSVGSRPAGEDDTNPVRFVVGLQASAVVSMKEGGEYLLQMGVECGMDYRDASNELDGTKEATKQRKLLEDFCKSKGLMVRPGVVQV